MATETFTATQTTVLYTGAPHDGDAVIDPGETVLTTVTITNNSVPPTPVDATGVTFSETLDLMTLVNQTGDDVNVSPVTFNDSYTAIGNTLLEVGNATSQTAPQSNVAGSVLANDIEFFGDTAVITLVGTTAVVGGTTVFTTGNGGTVTMVTDGTANAGSFTYISDAGFTGNDTFTYTIRDKGLDGIAGNADDLTSEGTVTIAVIETVWYIDNSFVGTSDGTSTNPFTSLADVSGAGGPDDPFDYIYVNTGSGNYTGGIVLENSQILHGEGAAFTVSGFNLAAAGTDPTITNAAGDGVTLATANVLTGFTVGNTTGFDITNAAALTAGPLTISDVTLNGSGGLINIDSGAGSANIQLNSATTSDAGTAGINLVNVDSSTFTVTGVTTINDADSNGIAVSNSQNSTFTFTGKTTILNDAVGANGDGVDLQTNNTVDSTFNFNGGVDITVNGVDAFGFRATSSGTVNILNPNSDNQITSNNGTAIFINPTAFNANLTTVTAGNGGTGDGIHLEGVSGTGVTIGTANVSGSGGEGIQISSSSAAITISDGSVSGTTGAGFMVGDGAGGANTGGTGAITYGGTVTTTGNARAVDIQDRALTAGNVTLSDTISHASGNATSIFLDDNAAGTITFSGANSVLNSGTSSAVQLTDNNGATINFTGGGLDIDTTSATGFSATGGGIVNVTGTDNTITSTTGIALNFLNTNIGASDITFESISAGTGAGTAGVGISLDTTGAAGGLHVTGDGVTADSGGTIRFKGTAGTTNGSNTDGVGIYLNDTDDVQLAFMQLNDFANYAIRGNNVIGLRLDNLDITGVNGSEASGTTQEYAVNLTQVTGTVNILNTEVSGGFLGNVRLDNQSGTTNLNFLNNNIHDTNAGFTGDGFNLEAETTATVLANISNNVFTNNDGDDFNLSLINSAVFDLTFNNNDLNGVAGATGKLGAGVFILGSNFNGTLEYDISNNNIQDSNQGGAIHVNKGSGTATYSGQIVDNVIGTIGDPFSGSLEASGIIVGSRGASGSHTTLIHSNEVYQFNDRGIIVEAGEGNASLTATITSNTVSDFASAINSLHGIHADLGILAGDDNQVTLDIRDNLIATAGNEPAGGFDLRVRAGSSVDVFIAGYGGGDNDANAQAFLDAANPNGTSFNVSSPGGTFNNGPASPLPAPNLPELPPAPLLASSAGGVDAAPAGDDAPPAADTTPPADDTPPPADTAPSSDATPPSDPAPAPVTGAVDHDLTLGELAAYVDAAITRWEAAGLSAEQVAVLRDLSFTVGDMDGQYLASFQPGLITLDADAAERGWYLDAAPLDDGEFGNAFGATRLQTDPTAQPAGHFDLLTTVMHEMGHALGLEDNYAADARDGLMFGWLFAGERRLPGSGEADGAVAGSITSEEFAGSLIQVLPADVNRLDGVTAVGDFVLPAGKTVTIQWHATVDLQDNQLIDNPSNVGLVTSTTSPGFADTNTTPNPLVTLLDTLSVGGTVWNDNGAGVGGIAGDGIKNGTEAGVNGVSVTLFTDETGSVAGAWDAGDTQIGVSILTAGGGNYSFTGLAPGEYIVRVDLDNFTAGGNTSLFDLGLQVSPTTVPEPPDPDTGDPDVDNDDNGSRVPGDAAYSTAITLAYNTEPTAGTGNDDNTTLDFGFLANIPPVAANVGPFSGDEDATTPLRIEITLSATDPDAGDAVESFKIETLPAGGSLFLASTGGAAISAGQVITATGGPTYTALVYFQPNADFSGTPSFTYTANDGAQDSNTATANITVTATPDVSVTANDVMGAETDATVTVPLSLSTLVGDVDASETLTNVVVTFTGAPTGLTAATGVLVDNGGGSYTLTLTPAQVAGASITVPADYSGLINGSAVANTNEGASAADPFTVTVTATAEPVTANDVVGAETDATVNIPLALSVAVDDDGSETLTDVVVTFTGAPAGMTAPTGTLIDNGGGSYTLTLTPAQVAGASITVPADYSGLINGSAVANSNEGASAADPFTVTVTASGDVSVTANDVVGAETDAAVTVNLSLSTLVDDVDASETLTNVVVTFTGAPAGLTAATGVLVDNGGGSYTLTLTPAQVAGASITVPADYSGLINGSAVANTNEGASPADPFTVTVTATAEPITANDVVGAETDATVNIPLALSVAVDDDGSETLTNVVVTFTGAPAGMTAPTGTLIDNGGGSYTLTLTPAQVAGASITVPADYAGLINGSAVANSNEGASPADPFTVTVTASGDVSVTANDVVGAETDAAVTVNLSLSTLIDDVDASETLTNVVVTFTGAPAGLTAATGVLVDNGGGSYTLTLTPAQVAGASITVPADYAGLINGSAVANTNEGASTADPFTVTVTASGDVAVTANDVSADETDAPVNLPLSLSTVIDDVDASETLTNVVVTFTGAPAGMTAPTGTLIDNGGGSYTLTLTPAQVAGASVTVPANYFGSFTGSAVANSNEGSSALDGFTVTVNSINDAPAFAGLGPNPSFTENGAAFVLDANATVSDVELDLLNAGAGNYNGTVLTLARNGGANADDVFGTNGTLSFSGTDVLVGATNVGTFTNAGGQLQITFNANANSALTDQVLQQITYVNTSDDPPASVQINYSLNDGNTGSQGAPPTPGTGTGSVTVNITQVNDRPQIVNVATAASYTIGSTGTVLSPPIGVTDIDSNEAGGLPPDAIVNAVVKIEDFYLGDQLFVNLPTSGGFFVVDDGAVVTGISVGTNALGKLVLVGNDSPTNYQQVLAAVSYRSTNVDPTENGSDSNRVISWQVNDGSAATPLFNAHTTFPTGTSPQSVAAGDFNGDGALDLVTANGTGTVSVLLGSTLTPGTFGAAVNLAAGTGPQYVTVGKFDANDSLDIVVANSSGDVNALFGVGDGTFLAAAPFPAGVSAIALASGDFNEDGQLDLAVADFGGGGVSILLGDSLGFAAPTAFATGTTPSGVAVGDFNRDGNDDLAVSNVGSDNVAILIGTGTGSFGAATTFSTGIGTSPRSIATADFNADGFLDLATANNATGNVSVLLGNGAGGFGAANTFGAGTGPHNIQIGDIDADGRDDIVVANDGSTNVSFLKGNGNGTFAAAVNFGTGVAPLSVALADVNNDGGLDLVVANSTPSTVSVLLNNGTNMSNVDTTLLAFNAPPTVDLDGSAAGLNFTTTFTENGATVAIGDTDLTITDPDSGTVQTLTIELTNAKAGDSLSLSGALPGGIVSSINTSVPGRITMILSNPATHAEYMAALGLVRFSNSSENPDITDRDITVVANDGEADGPAAHATVHVIAVNDAPVLSDVAAGARYSPNGQPVTIDPALTIGDFDNTTLASATVRISAGNFAGDGDVLAVSAGGLTGTGITAAYNPGTETLTLTGVDTLAHYEQVLEHVIFESTNPNPSNSGNNPTRTIEWVLNDGSGANNLSTPQHTTINLREGPPNDFNGDGFSDILWQNDNGQPGIWTMNGLVRINGANVGFNPNGGPLQTGEVGPWKVKAAGDFNADGHADILWQNDNGPAGIWLMDGFNVIGDGIVGPNPGSSWKVIDAADFNADGHADILWQNDNGTAGIWTMDGLTRTGGANVGFNPGPSWNVKAAGDFNADGHADILWQNDNGTAGIWLMDGFNVIGDGNVGFNPGPSWKVIDAGDFNADGHSDILWQNENGTPGIWTMDGLTRTGGANVGGFNPGPSWKVKTAGDYNGDGRSDILWQNDNGQPGIWLMDGFNVLQDGGVGFNPGPSWNVIGQHDLIG